MSEILRKIQQLAAAGQIRVSAHGYDELVKDDILAAEALNGIDAAVVVEEYPDYPKGPCVLVLQPDFAGRKIHVVWGIPAGHELPAVLVTAYRPDPQKWEPGFLRRKS